MTVAGEGRRPDPDTQECTSQPVLALGCAEFTLCKQNKKSVFPTFWTFWSQAEKGGWKKGNLT